MERLSGLDSAFLSMETPTMHLHVAIAAVIDPTTMAAPYEFEQLKAFVERRLMRDSAFRRRVVAVPFGLNHPIWVEDPDIDLDYHIRRHVLPFPGGPRELTDLTGSIVSVPLDRSRPLWEIHVVEGLYDGNIALIGKIHHAAVDGVSGAELFVHLFDFTPDAADTGPVSEPTPTGPVAPEHIPSDVELVGHALLSQARRTISLPALIGRTARTITHLVSRHRDPETVVGAVPLRAPRTPWSAAITPHRSVAFARVKLSDLKRVRAAFDVKVNDVVLAVVSGAVRRYLAEREVLPGEPLVAMCPVSVRDEDERGRPDNRVSAMFVYLRTDLGDVASRLRSIAHSTRGAKEDHHAIGAKFLQNWAEHAAPSTFALASRLYSRLNVADRHPPIYNVVVSNVPGPDFPLYLDGAQLVATYPMGPIMEGAGLNVTVLSYLDNVDFGFLAGAELVPDVWDMADHVDAAMAELLEAAAAIDGLDGLDAVPSSTPVPDGHAASAPAGEDALPPAVTGDGAGDTADAAGRAAPVESSSPVASAPEAGASSGRATAGTGSGKRSAVGGSEAETSRAKRSTPKARTDKASTGKNSTAGTATAKTSTGKKAKSKRSAPKASAPKQSAASAESTAEPATDKPASNKSAAKKPAAKKASAGRKATGKATAKRPASRRSASGKATVNRPEATAPTAKTAPSKKTPTAEVAATEEAGAPLVAAPPESAPTEMPVADHPAVEASPAANGEAAGEPGTTHPVAGPPSAEVVALPAEAEPDPLPAPDDGAAVDEAAPDTAVVDLVATAAIPTV